MGPSCTVIVFLTLSSLLVSAKLYQRCELARELRNFDLPEREIPTWVCIAQHESLLDTAAMNPGSGDHGLFQISQIYWCSPPGYGCNTPCEKFRDEDIADDLQCIRRIYNEHKRISGDGFNAWAVYPLYCKGDTSKYMIGCSEESTEIPGGVGNFTENEIPEGEEEDGDGYEFPPLPKYQKSSATPFNKQSIYHSVSVKSDFNDLNNTYSKLSIYEYVPASNTSNVIKLEQEKTFPRFPFSKKSIHHFIPLETTTKTSLNYNKEEYRDTSVFTKESIHDFKFVTKTTEEPISSEGIRTLVKQPMMFENHNFKHLGTTFKPSTNKPIFAKESIHDFKFLITTTEEPINSKETRQQSRIFQEPLPASLKTTIKPSTIKSAFTTSATEKPKYSKIISAHVKQPVISEDQNKNKSNPLENKDYYNKPVTVSLESKIGASKTSIETSKNSLVATSYTKVHDTEETTTKQYHNTAYTSKKQEDKFKITTERTKLKIAKFVLPETTTRRGIDLEYHSSTLQPFIFKTKLYTTPTESTTSPFTSPFLFTTSNARNSKGLNNSPKLQGIGTTEKNTSVNIYSNSSTQQPFIFKTKLFTTLIESTTRSSFTSPLLFTTSDVRSSKGLNISPTSQGISTTEKSTSVNIFNRFGYSEQTSTTSKPSIPSFGLVFASTKLSSYPVRSEKQVTFAPGTFFNIQTLPPILPARPLRPPSQRPTQSPPRPNNQRPGGPSRPMRPSLQPGGPNRIPALNEPIPERPFRPGPNRRPAFYDRNPNQDESNARGKPGGGPNRRPLVGPRPIRGKSFLSDAESKENDHLEDSKEIESKLVTLKGNYMFYRTKYGAPVLVSFPHFLYADEKYVRGIEGVKPDKKLHETYINLEPVSGTPLTLSKRVQFNMFIRPIQNITSLENIQHSLIPILWIDETTDLPQRFLDILKYAVLRNIFILNILRWVLLAIGLSMVVFSFILFLSFD